MTNGRGAADDASDFLEFAAAHQGPALRAATLVTGDESVGHAVALRALQRVAGDWAAAREEGPEGRLRRVVFREAVDGAPAPADGGEPHGAGAVAGRDERDGDEALDAPDDPDRVRAAVRSALAGLSPRARAVAVLRWLEDRPELETAAVLDVDADDVRADLDEARGVLAGVAGAVARPVDDAAARDLVELLAEEVAEVDLGRPAWEGARERSRVVRRRSVLAGGALVVGGATALALRPGAEPPAPRPAPRPSAVADGRLPAVPVSGARVVLAPDPAAYDTLPPYPHAAALSLPDRLGPGEDRPLELLSPAGSPASVRAVYLVRVGEGRYQPALLLPRVSSRPRLVAMAPLRDTEGPGGTVHLGPRTVDADRHRLVFPQPGAVVVLEVRSARTQRFEIRDGGLVAAGWAVDGHTVVASSRSTGWLVDTRTGRVTRTPTTIHAGWADIGVSAGVASVRTYTGGGRVASVRRIAGPDVDVYGDSVSNLEGWACRGVFLGEVRATGNRMQGLVAVQADDRPTMRILAAATASGVPLQTFRPLLWGPRDTVVVEAQTVADGRTALTVLAWDVIEDRLYRVGAADAPAAGPDAVQGFTGAWAL